MFTNGCFDIVHAGHIASFKQARSFGDVLFVGVNSDSSIKRIKGANRPVVDESNRVKLLEAVNCIDYLILFEEDTPQKLIENIIPAVLVKGKDWAGQEVAGGKFCGTKMEARFVLLTWNRVYLQPILLIRYLKPIENR